MIRSLTSLTNQEVSALAEEAFIFAYPMLENYKTMDLTVGWGIAARKRKQFNSLFQTTRLLGPEFTNIVAPNNDTLYSSSWLDLAQEPQVLTVPEVPSRRYYVFQLVDMYNYNFGYVGARTTGFSAGNYLIANHDWSAGVPADIRQVFKSETRFVFLLGRTAVNGPADLDDALAMQQSYKLVPLSQFQGRPPVAAEDTGPTWPAYDTTQAMSAGFISYLNFILGNAEIHPDDLNKVLAFEAIGIGPGRSFDALELPAAKREAINAGVRAALSKIEEKVRSLGTRINGWDVLAESHGPRAIMGGRPLTNAAGAMFGLYGNDKEEASNFMAIVDSDGNELDTSKASYRIRFDKDSFPPVNAFWSITMYHAPEMRMVANPIERYAIGDRTAGLVYGDDGSLEVYIQRDSPGPQKESNWLPGPDGPCALAMRNYLPDPERFEDYAPPPVLREGSRGDSG